MDKVSAIICDLTVDRTGSSLRKTNFSMETTIWLSNLKRKRNYCWWAPWPFDWLHYNFSQSFFSNEGNNGKIYSFESNIRLIVTIKKAKTVICFSLHFSLNFANQKKVKIVRRFLWNWKIRYRVVKLDPHGIESIQ